MENAIKAIFKEAIHRCCLFHVKNKIDDKGETVFEEMKDYMRNYRT
jgi:transposase-like protein